MTFTAQMVLDGYQSTIMAASLREQIQRRLIEEVKGMVPEGLGEDGAFFWVTDPATGNRILRYQYVLEDVEL